MDLTVAICSRNRCESLLRVLDSLEGQEAAVAWEILVVDNDSSDGTAAAIEARAERSPVPLRLEREPRQGLSFARNHALQSALGTNIVFLDDDTTCGPGFVAAHARALAGAEVVATGGRIVPILPPGSPPWFEETLRATTGGPAARYDFGDQACEVGGNTRVPAPFGANMGLRRSLALEVGGFREDLGWGKRLVPGEESELFLRMGQAGGRRMLYVPDAAVEHHIDEGKVTEEYFRRWYRGHGRSVVMIQPPSNLLTRVRRIAAEAGRVLTWRLRGLGSRRPRGEVLRKCSKAEGKLLQLLGW